MLNCLFDDFVGGDDGVVDLFDVGDINVSDVDDCDVSMFVIYWWIFEVVVCL